MRSIKRAGCVVPTYEAGDKIPAAVTPGLMSDFVSIEMRKATFYQATAGRADNGSGPLISGQGSAGQVLSPPSPAVFITVKDRTRTQLAERFIECAPQSRERGFWSRIDPRCLVPAFGGKADIKVKRTYSCF